MRGKAVVSCACVLLVTASAAVSASNAGLRASLRVVDLHPVVIRGAGFEPNERVRLMLSAGGGQQWRTKVAGPGGSLTARFGLSVGACGRFSVFAIGSRGSRARILPLRTQIDCVSPDRGGSTTHGDSTK
jgi:hypothetical protein